MLTVLARWATALRPVHAREPYHAVSPNGRAAADRPELRTPAGIAVERFVEGIQAGLDKADPERYDADFAADVLWGNPSGGTLAGIETLSEAHRSVMARGVAPDSRYEVVQMLAPAPGIAVAHVRRRALDGGFSEMALYVLIERGNRWWLAAGQNTPIAEEPAR
jgi:uncharacterized protein (TIGR02246 family)